MDKILFSLITCNRFHYFKSCLESVIEFIDMDRIDILICDNATVESGFDDYVNGIVSQYPNITFKKFEDRSRNELHRSMNYSIEFARERGCKVINFVQDDFQFLYRYDKLIDDVEEIFDTRKNIVQINCNMVWKRKSKKIGRLKPFNINGTNYCILVSKNPCDNGFTRVDIYDKIGLYPKNVVTSRGDYKYGKVKDKGLHGEVWFGRQCSKKGFKRAITFHPNAALLFDGAYVRGDKRYGRYFPPPNKYYIRPLNKNEIQEVGKRDSNKKWIFIENFCTPDGWKPMTFLKHCKDPCCEKI